MASLSHDTKKPDQHHVQVNGSDQSVHCKELVRLWHLLNVVTSLQDWLNKGFFNNTKPSQLIQMFTLVTAARGMYANIWRH